MQDNWDDIPKLKVSEDDFNFSELNINENYNNTEEEKKKSYYNNSEEKKLSFDIEKPSEKSNRKYAIWLAIIFFIVTLPICYNNYVNYTKYMNQGMEQQDLNVTVKNFPYQELYTVSEATGVVTPESSVDVVARVEGYLEETYFKEGDFVKKGQLLFRIESMEYEIAVRAAEAAVAQAKAVYTNALQELERGKELIKENFISRSDYDMMVASVNSSKASLDEVQQTLARARLNLNYTRIYAPLSGKVGKIALSNGNFVSIGSGALVNIAKINPIGVSFSMKSSDVINIKQGDSGKLDLSTAKVELILSDDSKFNKTGKISFSDNYVSSDAASLSLKAQFENPDNLLIPGDYVKVIVTAATPVKRILIPQTVVRGDALNGYYVWCAENNQTVKRHIKVSGSKDNHWIVLSGVSETDDIIVKSNTSIDMEKASIKSISRQTN